MNAKETFTGLASLIAIAGGVYLAATGKVTWTEFTALVMALVIPSPAHVAMQRYISKDSRKTPTVPPNITSCIFIGLACALLTQSACKFFQQDAPPTCQVIEAANQACTIIKVALPDGGTQSVQVGTEALRDFALIQGMKVDGGF